MFQVLVLVCAIGLPPVDCQTDTADTVVRGPEAANEIQCGLYGQVAFAETALSGRTKGQYLKVMCTRTAIGKIAG